MYPPRRVAARAGVAPVGAAGVQRVEAVVYDEGLLVPAGFPDAVASVAPTHQLVIARALHVGRHVLDRVAVHLYL